MNIQKIKLFLKDADPSIKSDLILSDNTSLNNIFTSITEAINNKHVYEQKEKVIIRALHEVDQYPLMYIYFCNLKECGILDKIIQYTPDFTDFKEFIKWFREHNDIIDIIKINNKIEEFINTNQLNKPNNSNEPDELGEANEFNNLVEIYHLIFKTTNNRKNLHDLLYMNKFISLDVQHDLESCDLIYMKYVIDGKHNLDLFIPIDTDGPNIETIAIIINCMDTLSKKYNNNESVVNLSVMFSNQTKNVQIDTNILCCDNINSGSTQIGNNKLIICWRREEFYKVLIHELFHYYQFDFFCSDIYCDNLASMLKLPDVDGIDMLNECYTESVAVLIMCMYLSTCDLKKKLLLENNKNDNNYNINMINDSFMELLKSEISFLMFQVAKIIYIFGGRKFSDYINNAIIIKQNTSFRSYFIIKLMLLTNMKELIKMMNNGMVIKKENLKQFGKLINSSYNNFINNEHNVNMMDKYIEIFDKININDDQWIYKTCRMTANEII